MQTVKVTKWGNSLGVRISLYIAEDLKIKAGDRLQIMYYDNKIVLTAGLTDKQRLQQYLEQSLLASYDAGLPDEDQEFVED